MGLQQTSEVVFFKDIKLKMAAVLTTELWIQLTTTKFRRATTTGCSSRIQVRSFRCTLLRFSWSSTTPSTGGQCHYTFAIYVRGCRPGSPNAVWTRSQLVVNPATLKTVCGRQCIRPVVFIANVYIINYSRFLRENETYWKNLEWIGRAARRTASPGSRLLPRYQCSPKKTLLG